MNPKDSHAYSTNCLPVCYDPNCVACFSRFLWMRHRVVLKNIEASVQTNRSALYIPRNYSLCLVYEGLCGEILNLFVVKIFYLLLLFFSGYLVQGQSHDKIKVAILGTFHFGETTDYKGGEVEGLLTPSRQKELDELTDQLAKYYPDKIFVENTPDTQRYWDKVYSDWLRGIKPTNPSSEKNEVFQVGIKLAKKLNNKFGVICVNYMHPEMDGQLRRARHRADSLYYFYSQAVNARTPTYDAFFKHNPIAKRAFDDFMSRYNSWEGLSITQQLIRMNEKESIASLHYINVMAWMDQNTNGVGAELTSKEYYRNARILQDILGKIGPFDKKVLVIIGAGHVKILQDMLESHPFFEVVTGEQLLK